MKTTQLPVKDWFFKGLSLVLIFTLLSTGYLLFNSTSPNLWSGFGKINLGAFGLACLALVGSWLIEVCRIILIAGGLGEKLSFMNVLGINLAATFSGNVTPFYSGGIPTQIYLLCRNGISPGKSSAIVTLRVIISTLIFTLVSPFLLLFYHAKFSVGIIRQVTTVAIPLSVLASACLILFIVKPKLASGIFTRILKLLEFIGLKKKIQPVMEKFLNELESFHDAIKEFRKGINFYLTFICSFLYWVCFFAIAPFLMAAFGMDISQIFWQSILFQFILVFIISYIPIPSGSGIMEFGFYSVFVFIPMQLRAIFILVWRFLSYHVATFIGGIILLRTLNRSNDSDVEATPN
ncbi:MAG TPA: flippase-like domain-containing protein [Bacillota bacterium]